MNNPKDHGPCSIEECDKRVVSNRGGGVALQLCPGHYHQHYRGEELRPLQVRRAKGDPTVVRPKPSISTEVRAWAIANGYDVPKRGKMPEHIIDAWRSQ
jgi:hypothetical protein